MSKAGDPPATKKTKKLKDLFWVKLCFFLCSPPGRKVEKETSEERHEMIKIARGGQLERTDMKKIRTETFQ